MRLSSSLSRFAWLDNIFSVAVSFSSSAVSSAMRAWNCFFSSSDRSPLARATFRSINWI
jgi:hypothetical protein